MRAMKAFLRALLMAPIIGAAMLQSASAGEATVAVAANFVYAAEKIRSKFQDDTGHVIALVSASTGKLASQAALGAPYDILLAADQVRPGQLIAKGHAVAGSQFTYASGRLVVWSREPSHVKAIALGKALAADDIKRIAIANPQLAPYGAAAVQALQGLGLTDRVKAKLIYGENIHQAYAFAASGNADVALVALSFMRSARIPQSGSYVEVPAELHDPIRQDAVLLKRGEANETAKAFLSFLKGPQAGRIMEGLGYWTTAGQ